MNFFKIVFLSLFVVFQGNAQTLDSSRNAIGVFGETNSMFSGTGDPRYSSSGLEYSKWNKKHLGYTVTIGYGNYSQTPSLASIRVVGFDTLTGKRATVNISMGMIGFGVQAERQFYKKVYFFAGFHVQAGYGSGKIDSTVTKEYNVQQVDPVTGFNYTNTVISFGAKTSATANMFYMGFTPSVGVKLQFKKFCIGAEFMNYVTFRSIESEKGYTESSVDFDFANITQRLFVQYRF